MEIKPNYTSSVYEHEFVKYKHKKKIARLVRENIEAEVVARRLRERMALRMDDDDNGGLKIDIFMGVPFPGIPQYVIDNPDSIYTADLKVLIDEYFETVGGGDGDVDKCVQRFIKIINNAAGHRKVHGPNFTR